LLNEERAIVSDIPGTTRDVIEDEMILDGIAFRFMDTAGLRDTSDTIEAIGVSRTRESMKKAALILYLFDLASTTQTEIEAEEAEVKALGIPYIKVGNKVDAASPTLLNKIENQNFVFISAATQKNLDA
jgi:tRNA modification GTPase